MTRAKQKNKCTVIWILDECLCQDKTKWTASLDNMKSLKELNLLSTKDAVISETLDTIYPNGKIIITSNKGPDDKGDFFKISPIQGVVKFSSDIKMQPDQEIYLKKFQQMVKNDSKLLGAKVTITKHNIVYVRGNKQKIIKYKKYI